MIPGCPIRPTFPTGIPPRCRRPARRRTARIRRCPCRGGFSACQFPPLNPQFPLSPVALPSFSVDVPRYQTKNLSPLSIVPTWKPRAFPVLPVMSTVSVLMPSFDLSPAISIGLVHVHFNCSTARLWSGRSPTGSMCAGSGLANCAVPLTLVCALAVAAHNPTAATIIQNRRRESSPLSLFETCLNAAKSPEAYSRLLFPVKPLRVGQVKLRINGCPYWLLSLAAESDTRPGARTTHQKWGSRREVQPIRMQFSPTLPNTDNT